MVYRNIFRFVFIYCNSETWLFTFRSCNDAFLSQKECMLFIYIFIFSYFNIIFIDIQNIKLIVCHILKQIGNEIFFAQEKLILEF